MPVGATPRSQLVFANGNEWSIVDDNDDHTSAAPQGEGKLANMIRRELQLNR